MSTNVRKVGYSVKLPNISIEKLKETCDILGQDYDEYDDDGFYPNFDNDKHLNQWIIVSDHNGDYGFVKVIDYEYDAFNLESSISLVDMINAFEELADIFEKKNIDIFNSNTKEDDFKVFSLLYYNGSDEPFVF